MVQRVHYRRRHAYNTLSNKYKLVKSPGGILKVHYHKKATKGPLCGDCGKNIQGIPHLRPREYANIAKNKKTVNRVYGGNKCATCVRNRIVRAFLIEEQKIVKKLLKAQAAKQ